MRLKKRNKTPKATLILNTIAMIMGIFAIFNIYKSHMYVSSLIEKGFDPSSEVAEVINYYLTTVTPYVFYGICLVALGYLIKKVDYLVDAKSVSQLDKEYSEKAPIEKDEDSELDKLFEDLDV